MLFYRNVYLGENTFLGELVSGISSSVTWPVSRCGKELGFLLHCAFKENMPELFPPSSFQITLYLGFIRVYILSFIITLCQSQICATEEDKMAYSLYL